MTNVCTFRMDDITPDMDWDKFYRVKAIFDKYKVKPLIGVVPDNQDITLRKGEYHEDFWEYIASLAESGWTIAQHGYRHEYETKCGGLLGINKFSEFAGLPYETQYEKLRKGREILQKYGINVTIFMAPGHSYDKKTLKALKKLGFVCVTDGYADIPYYAKGLLFVPCKSAKPKLSGGVDTICIHSNEMDERDYRELELFLEKYRSAVIPFSETMEQFWYPHKTLPIRLQEKRNLLIRKMKAYVADSERIQDYMQRTYDDNNAKKRRKRILGLPGLIFPAKKTRKNK